MNNNIRIVNNNRGCGVLFFLCGLATGVVLTALLTPRSGPATRRYIGRKVEEGKDWVKEKADAAQDYVRDQAEELCGRVKEELG